MVETCSKTKNTINVFSEKRGFKTGGVLVKRTADLPLDRLFIESVDPVSEIGEFQQFPVAGRVEGGVFEVLGLFGEELRVEEGGGGS